MTTCPCCGQDIATIDGEVRFREPDVLTTLSSAGRDAQISQEADDFVRLGRDRCFVRGLLPVRLSDGHEFHLGVWIEVVPATYAHLARAWNAILQEPWSRQECERLVAEVWAR